MRQINDHLKQVLNIPSEKEIKPIKPIKPIKMKKDYTRAILWGTIGVITIILWSIILSLI